MTDLSGIGYFPIYEIKPVLSSHGEIQFNHSEAEVKRLKQEIRELKRDLKKHQECARMWENLCHQERLKNLRLRNK